ncbi:hypothetical protein VTK26DRAFT_5432 [Humicola hyalothermophila]
MAASTEARHGTALPLAQSFATSIRRAVTDVLLRREDKDCHPQPGVNLCEKPRISSTTITWIVVGTALGLLVVGSLSVLIFLHLRRKKRDKREDMEDRFAGLDYGLDDIPGGTARKHRPDVSPNGYGRRSRDPLDAGAEPKYQNPGGGRLNGHLNPFDDGVSERTANGSSYPPSVDQQWPKRETS